MTIERAPAVHARHGLVDEPRRHRVDGGRGLVHHQDGRLLDQRARQAQALALAAGQRRGALAQLGVVALGQVDDELVRPRRARRRLHRFAIGASGRP